MKWGRQRSIALARMGRRKIGVLIQMVSRWFLGSFCHNFLSVSAMVFATEIPTNINISAIVCVHSFK